jgi:hypothetical protein
VLLTEHPREKVREAVAAGLGRLLGDEAVGTLVPMLCFIHAGADTNAADGPQDAVLSVVLYAAGPRARVPGVPASLKRFLYELIERHPHADGTGKNYYSASAADWAGSFPANREAPRLAELFRSSERVEDARVLRAKGHGGMNQQPLG